MELKILGPLEVRIGGRPVTVGGPRPRTLLALLIVEGNRVVSVDRLIDGVWGPSPPPAAIATVHGYVARLRRAIDPGRPAGSEGSLLVTEPGGYRLRVDEEALDAARFERLTARARAASDGGDPSAAAELLEEALGLWRGPAFADVAYEEAIQQHVARLEELRRTAAEDRVEAHLALGRHREMVADAEQLVASHPLGERPRAQLMRALYRAGRQVDALRVYREFRGRLREELGLDPSPELQALEADILGQDPALAWRPPAPASAPDSGSSRPGAAVSGAGPTNLPRQRSSFVGRQAAVREVADMAEAGALLTIVGPGGVGKTRLAIEVARLVRASHPDGTWLVELAPLRDAALVVSAVASAVGVREEPGRPLLATLVAALTGQHVLLVLDNCEHLVAAVAEVADALLDASDSLAILATSREPLGLEGERVWGLPVLEVPTRDDLPAEEMTTVAAVRLFCDRATTRTPFVLTDQNAPAVAQLTRRLDGLPLALELAASLVPTFGPDQILERLDRRFVLLTGGYRTAPSRQQTLQAAVEWGYDLLPTQEQRLFRRLGVFSGSFGVDAVERVCAGVSSAPSSLVAPLGSLVQRCMVEPVEADDRPRRYRLLETLRDFAAEQLEAAGEVEETRGRHLQWVLELSEAFEASCDGPEEQRWVDLLAVENDNLRQALEWSLRARPAQGLRMATCLGNFWARRGELTEGRRWLHAVLGAAPDAPLGSRALALRRAGVLALLQDDKLAALSLLHSAARLYRRVGDTASLGHVLGFLGVVAYEQGDVSGARHIIEESLEILEGVGDHRGVIRCRARLGTIAALQGDFARALPLLENAVAAHADLGDAARTAVSLLNLGAARLLEGALDEARALLEQSLALHRERGATLDIAQALIGLGEVDLAAHNRASAGKRFKDAIALARSADAPHIEAEGLLGLGTVEVRAGEAEAGDAHLAQAWSLCGRGGLISPPILERMAEAAVARGEYERAGEVLGASSAHREAMGVPLPPVAVGPYDRNLAELRLRLTPPALRSAWARGEASVGHPTEGPDAGSQLRFTSS